MYNITSDKILDKVLEEYSLPEAYEDWDDYRNELTDFILQHTEVGKTIAIIGAGESNDIDLRKIYQHFDKIALFYVG